MKIYRDLFKKLAHQYRVSDPDSFNLKDVDPKDTGGLEGGDKDEAKKVLEDAKHELRDLQNVLYADDKWSVLLIFQAMDAAGKDSTIEHVMTGINPQGCQVSSFGVPGPEEMEHDFMWRCINKLPQRGRIGIFNRSYYEETLVVRVHPQILEGQKLPNQFKREEIWQERFEDIRNFEKYLARNGTLILKFFLHVSKEEQKKRLLRRLDRPEKNWKFNVNDVHERQLWYNYQMCYEEMIKETSTEYAPWFVIPADHKWFTRSVVASAVELAIESLNLQYPRLEHHDHEKIKRGRDLLENEDD
ncbi:polyphosphate:ADP phosphotransferase [Rubritalea halochordaticola]|uniref:Polyphosphate:ADP phosphotransferase n=1 Tax=Rubritalea halochordaticola TaxID=714537 RepID=A0ABP9UWB3_9BACT